MDEGRGYANTGAMFVAGLSVIGSEADHNENETDQRPRGCADEGIEIAPLRHDVIQSPPPILDATVTAWPLICASAVVHPVVLNLRNSPLWLLMRA